MAHTSGSWLTIDPDLRACLLDDRGLLVRSLLLFRQLLLTSVLMLVDFPPIFLIMKALNFLIPDLPQELLPTYFITFPFMVFLQFVPFLQSFQAIIHSS